MNGGPTSSWGRYFGWAWAAGLVMLVATFWIAGTENLPIRDPDAFIPGYFRMPLIVLAAILTDILPRAVRRSGGRLRKLPDTWREVAAERWPRSHWMFALSGMAAWYLTYATFRNLKSFVPFVNHNNYDSELESIDRAIFFGHEPADLMHDLLGTGVAAQVMSAVYLVWIFLVPVSIAIALVYTRHTRAGCVVRHRRRLRLDARGRDLPARARRSARSTPTRASSPTCTTPTPPGSPRRCSTTGSRCSPTRGRPAPCSPSPRSRRCTSGS